MTDWLARIPVDSHWLIAGGTRRGKSGLLQLVTRAFIKRGVEGVTSLDPHGEYVRAVADWLANPANGQHERTLHMLDPASAATFGLNPLRVNDPSSWEECHAAANTLTSVIESKFEASPEETPRLSRIVYVAAMLCARHGLTLLELVEVLSIGGDDLRQSLLADFDNRIVRRELEDLHLLASRSPARFLELVESCKNRFVRWLGDRRLARILGQKRGLDPRAVMDGRHIVLFDGSSLSYSDAAFVGTIIGSMYVTAARHRPPLRCARHRLILDEAESLLTVDAARACDQAAKMGLNLIASVQRLGQLRKRGDFIADALLTNCAVKICFGGLEPESARYMAEALFTGYIDLQEWKERSLRPVVGGQHKEVVRNSSRAQHEALHETEAHTSSHTVGEAFSTMSSTSSSSGEFSGTGDASGMVMNPPASLFGPNVPNASFIQMPLSQNTGESSSRGSSEQSASSSGESYVSMETFGEATTRGRGTSRGTSASAGESEVFVPDLQWLPNQMYSIEEQLHRLAGELMNLPRRECFIKIEDQRPFRMRTADLTPAFRSSYFKALMLPLFLTRSAERSPYLLAASEVDAAIAARLKDLLAPRPVSEPDFTAPEPIPLVDAPEKYASDFWKRRTPSTDLPPKPRKTRPGRRPVGGESLGPRHEHLHVVDGDKKD